MTRRLTISTLVSLLRVTVLLLAIGWVSLAAYNLVSARLPVRNAVALPFVQIWWWSLYLVAIIGYWKFIVLMLTVIAVLGIASRFHREPHSAR